jgi:hypothetical protein
MNGPSSVRSPPQLRLFPGLPTAISYQLRKSCTNECPNFFAKQIPLRYTQLSFTMCIVTLMDLEGKSSAQQGTKAGITTLDDHEDGELDKINERVRRGKKKSG